MSIIDDNDLQRIEEIVRLLDEAYDHYFAGSDGHCKSSEGYVEVTFDNYFDRRDSDQRRVGVNIYSYVFGPHRSHYFGSIADGLDAVRRWHATEMATEYDEYGDVIEYDAEGNRIDLWSGL